MNILVNKLWRSFHLEEKKLSKLVIKLLNSVSSVMIDWSYSFNTENEMSRQHEFTRKVTVFLQMRAISNSAFFFGFGKRVGNGTILVAFLVFPSGYEPAQHGFFSIFLFENKCFEQKT